MNKKVIIAAAFAAIWFVLGGLCGFFTAKGIYDQPLKESVTRDTVTITDTVRQYLPQPVGVEKVRTEYKFLTRVQPVGKTDTLTQYFGNSEQLHDSVLVEVPIESKHYSSPEYDAYISGYLPSLDSISVYQKTEYVTERVVVSKPPNRFSIGLQGGYGYGFKSKQLEPFVGIGIGIRIF